MLKKYEGMFLFDPAVMPEWEQIEGELGRLMNRMGARVIATGKWDERRLAYEIRGRKRGVYALMYFEADPSKVVDLERDVALSEAALRCLIVRVDHMTEEEMKEAAARRAPEPAPEGPRGDRDGGRFGYGGDRYRRDRDRDREREAPSRPGERRSKPVTVEAGPVERESSDDGGGIGPSEGPETED